MSDQVYNLDDVAEFFEFQVGGNLYRFKHLSADELKEFKGLDKDQDKIADYLIKFISSVNPEAKPFREVMETFNVPQIKKFMEMMQVEFGIKL